MVGGVKKKFGILKNARRACSRTGGRCGNRKFNPV
jgi:hypothetical protein